MKSVRYRPRRRLRSEILPLVLILALPVSLYLAFPSGAIGFVPIRQVPVRSCAHALVTLEAKRESELLAAARSSWQSDPASRRGVRANLLACDFVEAGKQVAGGLTPRPVERSARVLEYEVDPTPHVAAAEAPNQLTMSASAASAPAFSREELLQLKEK